MQQNLSISDALDIYKCNASFTTYLPIVLGVWVSYEHMSIHFIFHRSIISKKKQLIVGVTEGNLWDITIFIGKAEFPNPIL